VAIILKQSKRAFVEKLDFVTSSGYYPNAGGNGRPGPRGRGPTTVITDLGVMSSDPASRELILTAIHPGTTVDQVRDSTGWPLKIAPQLETTSMPSDQELSALRDLHARTAAAHGNASVAE
jgi:glutaconate CoA-transferase subunit B